MAIARAQEVAPSGDIVLVTEGGNVAGVSACSQALPFLISSIMALSQILGRCSLRNGTRGRECVTRRTGWRSYGVRRSCA